MIDLLTRLEVLLIYKKAGTITDKRFLLHRGLRQNTGNDIVNFSRFYLA